MKKYGKYDKIERNIYVAKKYEELDFTDDFMFGKVLYHNPDLCRELLELILNRKIKKICFPETQKIT